MAKPKELFDEGKKSERVTISLEEGEALEMYREAARRDERPAVLLRKAVRLGMAALLAARDTKENESISGFGSL